MDGPAGRAAAPSARVILAGGATLVRAVVTGAAGFLGGALAHALRRRGDDVVAIDIRRAPGVMQADVSRPGEWEKAFYGTELVIHAAAIGTGGVAELTPVRPGRAGAPVRVSDAEIRRVTLGATAALLDAAGRAGVDRFVHLSCVDVLARTSGPVPGGTGDRRPARAVGRSLDETTPIGLTGDVRADAMAAAEQAVGSAAAHGLGATVLRIGDAYGPRAGRWTLWPVLLMRAGRFVLVDGGWGVLSPVHVDDVVTAVTTVAGADRSAVAGEVLHVTGGESVSAADFFTFYCQMLAIAAPRSVPARVFGAVDAIDRVCSFAEGYRRRGVDDSAAETPPLPTHPVPAVSTTSVRPSGSAAPAAPAVPVNSATSRRGPGLIRGVGARLVAGVDPRARVDLGPLTVRALTRDAGLSIEKIRARTGWSPVVRLPEGMNRTESWLRERGLLGVREPSRRG